MPLDRSSTSNAVLSPSDMPQVFETTIMVRNMRVGAYIGALEHERSQRQLLVVSVTLSVRPPPKDQLSRTLDYNLVLAHAEALADQPTTLIETYAMALAHACLRYGSVNGSTVTVRKPGALRNGTAAARVHLHKRAPPSGHSSVFDDASAGVPIEPDTIERISAGGLFEQSKLDH